MKKIFALGLMLVALTLTNCAKNEEVAVAETTNFELFANADARTVNDGLSTKWASGDALTVCYIPTGGTTYTAKQFTLADATTGKFTGTATLTEGTYDWYAYYPYSSYIKDPKGTAGYMNVGAKAGAAQTQNGNNSMAHIAGSNYPLVGKTLNVASDEAPVITMSHVCSLIEFEVTNSLDKGIFVETIAFTSSEDIQGTYYTDWTGEETVLKGSGDGYVTATATLNVTNATAIAAGAKAKFYLAVKPHTVAAGKSLSLMLTANDGANNATLEKTITVANATTFAAGAIKTVGVNFNVAIEAPIVKAGMYVKLTAAPADWSGKYLIVMGDKKVHSKLNSKDFVAECTSTFDPASVTEIESEGMDAYAMTVAASSTSGKYTMKYPDGKYFSMVHNGSGSSTTAFDLTFEYTSSGVKIAGVPSGKTANYYLYTNTNNGTFFRCYVDKNGMSGYTFPTLYKFVEE